MEELKDYVISNLLSDPIMDNKMLITEFLAGYFGAALST